MTIRRVTSPIATEPAPERWSNCLLVDGIAYISGMVALANDAKALAAMDEYHQAKAVFAKIKGLRAGKASLYVAPELADVPVNFLTTLDITGGNSGSPTLDGRGELVGLVFDGTFDTVASDFVYDTVRTRSIHADVRYLLWTMTEVDGAGHLVEEMGIR